MEGKDFKKNKTSSKPSGDKYKSPRDVDALAKNVNLWWSDTLVFVTKTRIKTWKGTLILSFVSGIVIATVWGVSVGVFQGSLAGFSTALILDPPADTVQIGDTFDIDAVINTDNEDVVAVKAVINYDKDSFALQNIDTSGSRFAAGNTCQYQSKACEIIGRDDANGQVTITLAKPSPGINTVSGMIATLTFTALQATSPSSPNISFYFVTNGNYTDSDMIANDGAGTDTLDTVVNATVTVTPVTPLFACTGNMPSYAGLCAGDNGGLTANTDITLVDVCGEPKCEYACNTGYVKEGSSCVPIVYSCIGDIFANASLCLGDNANLTVNTPNSLVDACGTSKCEYTCSEGYEKSGSSCVARTTYSCAGLVPENAGLCAGDSDGLTVDVVRALVAACGTAKCEYTCGNGYAKDGNGCVVISESCTDFTYSDWSSCSADGIQSRTVAGSSPDGCTGGSPDLEQECTPSDETEGQPEIVDADRPINIEGEKQKFGKSDTFYNDDKSISFKGANDDIQNGKVKIYSGNDLKKEITAGSDGKWKAEVKVKSNGDYKFRLEYYNSNGDKVADSKKYIVKVDTEDPEFTDLPLFLNKKRGDKIWWKAKDNRKIKEYKIIFLGKTKTTTRDSFNVPADAPRGPHILKVRAYDKAGNVSSRVVSILVR